MAKQFSLNRKAINTIITEAIDKVAVPRMQEVADRCNNHIDSEGYMVSVEGDDPLDKRDYRATVITADAKAMMDNARHDRLVTEFK
ncbi:hypothetical protein [Mycolicibacterium septicum]|uniref:hypothetical protein n=1 Tax=Mycolicibacterium septicum TaxID=98668 RepID=UPI001AF05641|nr:hypothetical protein [Mycolicibacterium septicum]QRY51732.1 hypothetical protein JVX95_30900 [Mycolicibacterium septicum]